MSALIASRPVTAQQPQTPGPANARVNSRDLLRGQRELVIEHHGQEYRLILTRNDKLILNK